MRKRILRLERLFLPKRQRTAALQDATAPSRTCYVAKLLECASPLALFRFLSFARSAVAFALCWCALSAPAAEHFRPATLAEVVAAKEDLWGQAALRQTNGASYEFFASLLPPPRYVNADFKYYPVVLSAPNSKRKARWISNGSGLNLPGGTRSWHDLGTPVTFRVGPDELRFGEVPQRVRGPRYGEGYLPIVEIEYAHGEATYRQEAFAAVDEDLAENGVVFVRFSVEGTNGQVAAQFGSKLPVQAENGAMRDEKGATHAWFSGDWKWTRQRLVAQLRPGAAVVLAVPFQPIEGNADSPLRGKNYAQHRDACVKAWNGLLGQGMRVEVPEKYVNQAWQSLVCQNFALVNGDRIHYSAGNQYDRLYEAEGCDATQALLVWGFTNDVKRLIPALLDFTRKGLEYHQAGHKLQLLAHYFALTRDTNFVRKQKPHWEREVRRILEGRTNQHGLFPREQYCGDVATPVFSLNSNAKCWRALRDFSVVAKHIGEDSRPWSAEADKFRGKVIAAVKASEVRDVQPPFIPIALFGDEKPYDPITGIKIGSYWNLMANYVVGSEVFGVGAEREDWLLDYVQQHGGLCMGLIRSRPNPTFWTGPHSINPLYGLRRSLTLLRRDEADQALVGFYGMLAQGMTRDTFIGAEGCSLTPLDEGGRLFYCPPNSASNGFFLWMLRCLLVQDWDLDDDGEMETLRLMHATSRRWLEDGKVINVERAPTAFGDVSVRLESRLQAGEVLAEVVPPPHPPKSMLLRVRLPEGWAVKSVTEGGRNLPADESGTVDISSLRAPATLRFAVSEVR